MLFTDNYHYDRWIPLQNGLLASIDLLLVDLIMSKFTLEYQIVPFVDLQLPSVAWPCHPLSENVPWVDVNVPFVDVCLALKLHSHKKL